MQYRPFTLTFSSRFWAMRSIEYGCRTVYFDKVPKARNRKDTRGATNMVAERRVGRIVAVQLIAREGEDLIVVAVSEQLALAMSWVSPQSI